MSILSRSQLADPDRIRLEEHLRRFQENWNSDNMKSLPAAFEHYLPPTNDPLRAYVLAEVVTLDLVSRWRIGQKVRIEFYLSAFPELSRDPERVVSLIYEEFRIRAQMQEPVAVNAFQDRFPDHFDHFYKYVRNQVGSGETAINDTIKARPDKAQTAVDAKSFVPDFSRYELVKRLGAGQFGEVWQAKAPGGVDVALKIIPWPSAHKMSQMELRALEVMKRLRHAFLVQVHAYWPMENQVAIVMEMADGSLEDRLKECRAENEMGIPREELIEYMAESAEALDHLHQEQVLHRDIKPANILIVQGHAKLGDFGVARLVNAEPADMRSTCVGTPQFMAPEVWENKVQPASDQYSLAITYVELRIGRPVFMAESLGELLRSHTTGTPDLDPIPPIEQGLILRALAKRPEDRYSNCVEFTQALRDMVTAEHRKVAQRGEIRKRRIIIGSIIGIAASAAAVPFFMFGPGEEIDPHLDLPADITLSAGGDVERFFVSMVAPSAENKSLTPDNIKLSGHPDSVQVDLREVDDDPHRVAVLARADLMAEPGTSTIKVDVTFDDETFEGEIALTIQARAYLPPNTSRTENAELVRVDGKVYWSEVALRLPNDVEQCAGLPIEFVLIPRTNSSDPATFYISKHMVWNALYQEFWDTHQSQSLDESWKKIDLIDESYTSQDHPRRPVFRINVEEANRFAAWCNGKLPTEAQWEKAAGRFDRNKPDHTEFLEGPYQGTWDPNSGGITVGGELTIPTDVGAAQQDVTCFGVRDMSGNGHEFTCLIRRHDGRIEEIPVDSTGLGDRIITKSQDYMKDQPLKYSAGGALERAYLDYWKRSEVTGFRIILPLLDSNP